MPIGVSNSNIGFDPATKKVTMKQPSAGALPNTGVLGSLYFNNNNSARAGLGNIIKRSGIGTNDTAARGALTAQFQAQPKPQQGFSYDPSSDPVYQKAIAQAKTNATAASGDAMAALNKRGILDSTITSDRVAGIQQDAVSNVDANLLPQLSQQAFQRYQDTENQKSQADQLAIQQGQLTGTYLSPEMKQQYAAVTQAKQDYANAKTPEERIAAHQRADAARSVLSQMGANPDLAGSGVTLDQANANASKYGVQTQAAKEYDTNMTYNQGRDKVADKQWQDTFDYNDKVTMANLTGKLPDGTPTTTEQQRSLDNLWTAAGQTGVIPNELADMLGIKRGTKTQAAYQYEKNYGRGVLESDRNYKHGLNQDAFSNGMSQSSDDLSWLKYDSDKAAAAGQSAEYNGLSANQVLDTLQKRFTDPATQKQVAGLTPQKIYETVVGYGLPDGQDDQVMISLGMTKDQIAALDKSYAGK